MKRATVGVIGHVDHGKTALVGALTGTDTDRLAEEKKRGISIALGFAHFRPSPDTQLDLIDMPGHERFVRTMISGATGIDAVLLVVAANEGIKPQTVEHCDIAALLGLQRAVVAVSKADLVTPDEAKAVGEEGVSLLGRLGIETGDPILTSAENGTGLDLLSAALSDVAQSQPPRAGDGLAWLPIDRAFTMTGHGQVVTGTLRGSTIGSGDTLELHTGERAVRVRSVQVHGEQVETGKPGQRVALNLRDVGAGDLSRGMALATPGACELSEWLTIALQSVENAPPLPNGMRLRAMVGTGEVDARLRLLDRDMFEPGASGFAQLHLAEPMAVPAREHAIVRIASPARTVAGGRILEPVVRRRRRFDRNALARLTDLRDLPEDRIVAAEIERAGAAGTSVSELSRLTALAPAAVERLLSELAVFTNRKGLVFRDADIEELVGRVPGLLELQPAGLSRNQLVSALQGCRTPLLDEALARLMRQDALIKRGGQYVIPREGDDWRRETDKTELADSIARTLQLGGMTPPNPNALIVDAASKRAVESLLKAGTAVRAIDRAKGRELIFHRDAIADARRILSPLLEQGDGMLVTDIAAALGISRKFTMPLLDHLDTIRFTRRVGDRRRLFTANADLH
ncbi:MAG: selenocysteine-specific translation elongation factor [Novosphingobium sp.]|nr:selenocysteine-specific translation elongation factor [Novosphingobium sp.]